MLKIEKNKSLITNLVSLVLIVIGKFSPIYSEIIFTIGVFAFSGAVTKPGAYQHQSDTSVYTAVHTVKKAVDADRSYVYIITPTGSVEEKGIAYWNIDAAQLMPGSQVYVPISPELFSNKLKVLNKRVAALAVHRVLPQ